MKRPLFIVAIGYIFGIITGLYQKIGIAFILFFILKLKLNKKNFIIIIVCFILSYIHISFLENMYDTKYDEKYDKVNMIGVVVSNPIKRDYSVEYTIKVKKFNQSRKFNGTKLILKVKKSENDYLKYGQIVQVKGEFEKAKTSGNYKGFDYREYLRTKGVHGIITSNQGDIKVVKENGINLISILINNLRLKINFNIDKILPEENSALCLGILIGDRNEISKEIEDAFRDSSLTHMLAVSGGHVAYIIMGMNKLFEKIRINKRLKNTLIIILLFIFMILTGASPSVERACIVGILATLAEILYKQSDTINNLSLSLIIILLINPYSIVDVGLLMSYAGTIGIIYFNNIAQSVDNNNKKSIKIVDKIKQSVMITVSANLLILPISIYSFSTISLTFILSNVLAAPLLEIIIILGFISFFISLISIKIASLFGIILDIVITLLINICKFFAGLGISKIYIPTPHIILIILYYILIFMIFYYKKYVLKYKYQIISITCIIVLCVNLWPNILKNLRIYFIDVGQGDSTLIITPSNKKILIDGGGSNTPSSNFDVGESIVLPYLLNRGVNKLDYIIISHFDSDHCGGLLYIMREIKVKNIIIPKQFEEYENYKEFINIIKEKSIKVYTVEKGQKINIEKNLYFDVLWPSSNHVIRENSINNNSLVCKLLYKNFSILFTGDIEEVAEKAILNLNNKGVNLKSTILKLAHHGSKTSTTQEFLEAVSPKAVLIGVGKDNKFGHPADEVIQRVEQICNSIHRTDENGEISILSDGKKYRITNFKEPSQN